MRRFGLIGWPVSGSDSPRLFAAAYGGAFTYDLIESPDFEVCFQHFLDSYDGVNVTAPFKTQAFLRADRRSPECMEAQAANILVKTPQGIAAHNSDVLGVQAILRREGIAGKALIVGYGGAGRAAAAAARSAGLEVTVVNRTLSPGLLPLEMAPAIAAGSDIVIYTLPCAVPGMEGIRCPVLLEANYRNPVFRGAPGIGRYIDGYEWLKAQAREGYALLTGIIPASFD